ncbi:unnamed protein product [Rhizopus microsporus]
MSLTQDGFRTSLLNFYDNNNNINNNEWNLIHVMNHVYLKKACFLQAKNNLYIHIEYHILYSTSYQVPVLYFKPSYYHDGSPLSLDDIYEHIVPFDYHQQLKQHVYVPCISQADHPLINTPFWYIHPCETAKLMTIISPEVKDYVQSWLSLVGPVIRCYVPKALFS